MVMRRSRNIRHQMLRFPVCAFRTTESAWAFCLSAPTPLLPISSLAILMRQDQGKQEPQLWARLYWWRARQTNHPPVQRWSSTQPSPAPQGPSVRIMFLHQQLPKQLLQEANQERVSDSSEWSLPGSPSFCWKCSASYFDGVNVF